VATVEKSVEVSVPVRTAYNQWTQFEEFPRFMDGVEEIKQLDDKRLHWRARVGGKLQEWDAEITEQVPDQRVAWRSTSGDENFGVVTFHSIDPMLTRIVLRLEYTPEGALEHFGDALGVLDHRVQADLKRFKDYIETRGSASGGWRGTIQDDTAPAEPPDTRL
jgi:uncharacterized membrane protein